jgi:shikimate kinase
MTADPPQQLKKTIVLVGLMGAGKTSVGRRLADLLALNFVDADEEITRAAGRSIEDIFEDYGEKAFRDVEERVIQRLLQEKPRVLATGGGAFMNPRNRQLIAECGISVWLRADLDVLVRRTSRRGGRPLLKNTDHKATLGKLIEQRYPVYGEADIIIDSREDGPDVTARVIKQALESFSPSTHQDTH